MSEQVIVVIVILVLVGMGILWVVTKINTTRCPSCNKLWAKTVLNRETVSKEPFYKTVTRYDIKKDSSGNEISRTERKEQIHMLKITNRIYCGCKQCNYLWDYIETKEIEG